MKKLMVLCVCFLFLFSCAAPAFSAVRTHKRVYAKKTVKKAKTKKPAVKSYRNIDTVRGIGNIIFSTKSVEKGGESKAAVSTSFEPGDPIYGLAYFPQKLGALRSDEDFFLELWVDKKLKKRAKVPKPEKGTEEMQLYITGMDDNDFPGEFESLFPGNHKIKIVVGHQKYISKEKVIDNGRTVWKKNFVTSRLAEGMFDYAAAEGTKEE